MNWMARNLAVIIFGALTSVITAVVVIYVEARTGQQLFTDTGQTLFGSSWLAYVPLGAIFAGFVGSVGYLAVSLRMRNRPALVTIIAILATSAGVVFLVQSAEFGLFIGAKGTTRNVATFSRFLGRSITHSPLQYWFRNDDGSDDELAGAAGSSRATAQAAGSDPRTDGNVLNSQDASEGRAPQAKQTVLDFHLFSARVKTHGGEWFLLALETVGFALGGLLIVFYLRALPHCKDCKILLGFKGERTRYFIRMREMRSAVDDVLLKARDRQLQQSILAHVAKGLDTSTKWAEFASTLEIRRCGQCRAHTMEFRARRKEGAKWKDIDLLEFSGETMDPLDFA